MGLDPDSTYLIMSVWPIKNPHMAMAMALALALALALVLTLALA